MPVARFRTAPSNRTAGWVSALLAAQDAEDKRSDHPRQHSDVGDRPGRPRQGWTETTSPRSPAATARPTRTGPAYIADVIGKEMGQLPVADRRQIVGLLAGEGMSNRA